ncbi:hypothetical protein As57867_016024, partial [Aphanomyces stellatus]
MRLPPPPSKVPFKCPALTEEEIHDLVLLGDRTNHALHQYARLDNPILQWHPQARHGPLTIYEGRSKSNHSHHPEANLWMATTTFTPTCTIDVMASHLHCTDSLDPSFLHTTSCQPADCVDAARLYTLMKPSPTAPHRFVGIHWTLHQARDQHLPREWCYLESHASVPTNGRHQAFVQSRKSIDVAACPERPTPLRASHICSGLIVQDEPTTGHVRLTHVFHGYPRMQVDWPAHLGAQMTALVALCGGDATTQLPRPKGLGWPLGSTMSRSSTGQRQHCERCWKRILFGTKYRCVHCDHVVCRGCSRVLSVKTKTTPRRVCVKCTEMVYPSWFEGNKHASDPTASTAIPLGRRASIDSNASTDTLVPDDGQGSSCPQYFPCCTFDLATVANVPPELTPVVVVGGQSSQTPVLMRGFSTDTLVHLKKGNDVAQQYQPALALHTAHL